MNEQTETFLKRRLCFYFIPKGGKAMTTTPHTTQLTTDIITCRLYLPLKNYLLLSDKSKALFETEDNCEYFAEFPAPVTEDSFLGEYIIAFCEVALIMPDPKYQLTPECNLESQLLKLGQGEDYFNLLLTITYPSNSDTFHDILIFKEREQRLGYYSFELVGDQTVFSME